MNDDAAERAVRAYKALKRIARRPEREPAWKSIIADLEDAESYYLSIDNLTPDQFLTYRRIRAALKR
jgi:hypothetical protein